MSVFIDDATDDRFTSDKIGNMSSERFELVGAEKYIRGGERASTRRRRCPA
jgi:hypothetical protein